MPRISRFKRRDSDRSGFKFYEIELVKQEPWKVSGDEFDMPPPSRVPLGGEADVAPGDQLAASGFSLGAAATTASSALFNPTVYITAAGGISPSFAHPWMALSGSNGAVTITAIPQILRGREGQLLTLQCVGSTITLTHGSANAVNLMGSTGIVTIQSGMILSFVFNTANQAWNEVSRSRL